VGRDDLGGPGPLDFFVTSALVVLLGGLAAIGGLVSALGWIDEWRVMLASPKYRLPPRAHRSVETCASVSPAGASPTAPSYAASTASCLHRRRQASQRASGNLQELHDSGVLSDDEFAAAKAKSLA
jgi:hypothetical protein